MSRYCPVDYPSDRRAREVTTHEEKVRIESALDRLENGLVSRCLCCGQVFRVTANWMLKKIRFCSSSCTAQYRERLKKSNTKVKVLRGIKSERGA